MTTFQHAQLPTGTTPYSAVDCRDGESFMATTHRISSERSGSSENAPPKPGLTASSPAEDVTTKILQFLATATTETLGALAVGMAAVTYLLLGQLGLLFIGAFAGVVMFIQWQGKNPAVARITRGERSTDVLDRLLRYNEEVKALSLHDDDPNDEESVLTHGLESFRPETREALKELVDAVIDDYVKWWYSPILPSERFFPLSCRKVLISFLLSVSSHLGRKRPADAFLDFLTNSSSIIIVFFSELSAAFAGLATDSKASVRDVVYDYLASNPDSNLANLLNQRQQVGRLRMVAEDLLMFLDRSSYDCEPVKVFLREILAGVVLETTLQTCSKPEWINGWIVYLLEAGEPDFSQAIDVGMQTGPSLDNTLVDFDGNVGNIGLAKGNRNSFDSEKSRRKESMAHKKKLSKADEEMEMAMEEMKRMNQMIAEEEARRADSSRELERPVSLPPGALSATKEAVGSTQDASERFTDALKRNANDLEIPSRDVERLAADAVRVAGPVFKTSSSGGDDNVRTPVTPVSVVGSSSRESSPKQSTGSRFTSFDQILPLAQEEGDSDDGGSRKPPPLTLHNATITVLDEPGDKGRIRAKPSWDYLIQIEPATTHYPGWMIVKRYSDFEALHEILRRIATISGATAFTEQHKELPNWKVHTRSSLRGELERYLREACWSQSLAESEGMKKFLEKEQRLNASAPKSGLQAFEKLGKNVFDVLTSAPVEGSRAVVGGVTGVLGNIGLGQKKTTTSSSLQDVTAASRLSMSTPPRADSALSLNGSRSKRDSMDSQRSSVVSTQPGKMPPMERRPSYNSIQGEGDADSLRPSLSDRWERPSLSGKNSRANSRASSRAPARSPSSLSLDGLRLPPPPDLIPDDFGSQESPPARQGEASHPLSSSIHTRSQTMPSLTPKLNGSTPLKAARHYPRLSEQETRVAVELLFAVINELYTLSSAWNIRRTLLAAAKSFLLRPGNPSLVSIQSMIQSSLIDANVSDAGIAAHLRKLRENALPTESERAAWPPEMTSEEKDKLRFKARKLLIESGVPAALSGVMGQSATSEALGRVFDCLQIEEVARGLIFGIMLQAARIITH
ncbi:hypothetical protein VTK73DRAFT_9727 [Phialemonium thermophilum]|uniref:PXA domain-containing protein n=1 Tax=Phialemonium thermophilum TaxID=223376 RepID=A0ABR3XJ10_9PEZI